MGCTGSRLDGNGNIGLSPKLRPLFLLRLQELKASRHARPAIKNSRSTPSKELPLLRANNRDEDRHPFSSSSSTSRIASKSLPLSPKYNLKLSKIFSKHKVENPGKPREEASDMSEPTKDETKGANEYRKDSINGDHEEHDADERMIRRHDDDGCFPGSPSFRVYFHDNGGEGSRRQG